MKVQLAKVVIDDKNGNGVLDTKKDRLENSLGQSLSLQSKEVKELMAQLGVKSLEGVSLADAARYLQILNNPQNPSSTPKEVEALLNEARQIAKKNGFVFDENKAEALLKKAYKKEMEKNFTEAQRLAREGIPSEGYYSLYPGGAKFLNRIPTSPVSAVKALLQKAQENAEKAGEASYGEKAYEIQLQALATGIEITFGRMRELGFLGLEKGLTELYAEVLQYAQEGDLMIDPERAQTLNKFKTLVQAHKMQRMAQAIEARMQWTLKIDPYYPREYLMESQISILKFYSDAEALCRSVGVDLRNFELELALLNSQAVAYQGKGAQVEAKLEIAEDEAKKIGVTLDPERLKKIRLTSLSKEFVQLNSAMIELVKNGDVDGVQGRLEEIQLLANLIKEKHDLDVDFTSEQKETILKTTRQNRLEAAWNKIPELAQREDLTQLFETVKIMEADSKELGLPFDLKKVDALMKPGLLKRLEGSYIGAEHAYSEDHCKGQLEKAKRFAKEAGVKFDTSRARAILKKVKGESQTEKEDLRHFKYDWGFGHQGHGGYDLLPWGIRVK